MSAPPSFPSFPTFGSFPDLQPGPSKEGAASEQNQRRKKRHDEQQDSKDSAKVSSKPKASRDKHDRLKQKKRARDTPSDRYGADERNKADEDAQWRVSEFNELTDIASRPVYYSDRKGDSLNVKYGRIHAGDIPKYSLLGRGRKILGLNNAFTVVHRGRGGLEIDVGKRRRHPALTDSSSRYLLRAPPTKRYVGLSEDKYKYSEVDGFLRLPDTGKRKTAQATRDIFIVPDSEGSETSSGAEEDFDSDDSDAVSLTSLQATLKALETQLSAEPTSIPTWLSLLSHTVSTLPPDSKNAQKARSEVALSVLSRALVAHPENAKSQQLRLKYIHAGEEVWTAAALETEWERALEVGTTEIWIQWLDWRVRVGVKVVEGIVDDGQRVLSSLSLDDENGRLRAFWRIAIAFRDAGFVERANAMFQAQAELLFKRPAGLSTTSFNEVLDALEEFWESEVPRLGEANAIGWAAWEAAGKPEAQASSNAPVFQMTTESDPYVRWALTELSACRSVHSLPARSATDDVDNDPYATILFSDIRPFLLDLHSTRAKQNFRLVWLSSLGLHVPGLSASLHNLTLPPNTDDRWSATHFGAPDFQSSLFPSDTSTRQITADAHVGVLVGREREYSATLGPIKNWNFGVFDPLEPIGNEHYTMFTREDLKGVNITLVKEIFGQCRLSSPEQDWDILRLAIEGALDVKAALKISKAYLATAQDSLQHWMAHARLERLRGRPNDARKVYSTVLPSIAPENAGAGRLWWDWAELEWRSQSTAAVIQIILRSTSTLGSGTVALLRCKRRLDELHNAMPASAWKDRQAWLKLRVLLEILTTSVSAGLLILDSQLSILEEGSLPHESLEVASLMMLYVDGTILRNPIPPALLRERAEAAIGMYPSNTVILGLFLEAEKGQAVWGKVRLILGENTAAGVAKDKDLARRFAEVWAAGWEKGRWKAEEERTRTSLSAAAQDERTRGSAILWRLYIEFEVRAGQLHRAKKLLFRAIGECPLVKELYLLGFVQLRSIMSTRELKELAETMAERGIRLREGLDEALEDWAEPNGAVLRPSERDDVGDDDIEYNAEEYRRLRPY